MSNYIPQNEPTEKWWQPFEDTGLFDSGFLDYAVLEQKATTIRHVSALVVPGILQTEQYALALIGIRANISQLMLSKEGEKAVKFRLARQWHLFERSHPPQVFVIVDESALLRIVGSRRIMHDQLLHLLQMAELPFISLQVMPLRSRFSDLLVTGSRSAVQLSFASRKQKKMISIEQMHDVSYNSDNINEVTTFITEFMRLQEDALDPAASIKRIQDSVTELLNGADDSHHET